MYIFLQLGGNFSFNRIFCKYYTTFNIILIIYNSDILGIEAEKYKICGNLLLADIRLTMYNVFMY